MADSTTGDSKTREEERDGDVVRGSYSVADPDGRIRTVTYTADALNGFQVYELVLTFHCKHTTAACFLCNLIGQSIACSLFPYPST